MSRGDETLLPSSVAIAGKSRALACRFVKGRKCFRWSVLFPATGNTSGSSRPLTKGLPVVNYGPMATDDGSSPCSLSSESEGWKAVTQPSKARQVFDSPNSDGSGDGCRR